ncbi:hypothetical protein [Streptomyces fuscichromogenes]|uniref:Uncharacterized protein n=1 Tax=Streptomyces fuscichromogenes TaxID=1324013 RepID=A0A918CXS8_9ACTN|nr:hypothetical protein [Streptomyces fuscichromogenes]GGN47262.1 hypothetical protein GCM10011578_100770 [Streptomyces fuscichromogenes]
MAADRCTAAAAWPPAAAYFGLAVDLGDWHTKRGIWLHLPRAVWTCREGCEAVAVGAVDVAHLTEHLDQACPHAPVPVHPIRTHRKGAPR